MRQILKMLVSVPSVRKVFPVPSKHRTICRLDIVPSAPRAWEGSFSSVRLGDLAFICARGVV